MACRLDPSAISVELGWMIVLYLKFAPSLQYTLDPSDPDGYGGIKKLGDSLWFFGGLIGVMGILVSIHMFGVSWTFMHKQYVQFIFLFWVSLPYILAVSIVLISRTRCAKASFLLQVL